MKKLLNSVLAIGSNKTESEIIAILCRDLGYSKYDTATVEDVKNGNFEYKNYAFAVIFEKFFTDQLKEFIKILRKKQNDLPVIFFSKYSTLRIENAIRLPSITLMRNMKYAMEKLDPKLKSSHTDIQKINSDQSATIIGEETRLKNIMNRASQKQPVSSATILDLQRKMHLYDTFILVENNASPDRVSLFFHEGYIFLIDYSKTTDEINKIYNWQSIVFKTLDIDDRKDIVFLTKNRLRWKKSEFIWNASKHLKKDTIKALNIFPEGSFKISFIAPSFIISRYQMMIKHFSLTLVSSEEFTLESLRYRFPTHFDEILRIITTLYFGNIVDIVERKPTIILDRRTKKESDVEPTIEYKTVTIKKGFLSKIIDKIRGL